MHTKAAMGNSRSIDDNIEDQEYYLRPKIDSEKKPLPVKKQIDVCLACQQNSMTTAWGRQVGHEWVGQDIDKIKDQLKAFFKEIYLTTSLTKFTWTTWDVEDADIVLERDTDFADKSNIFDAVVSLHCEYMSEIPGDTFKTMCRFVKPYGLFIEAHSPSDIVKRLRWREVNEYQTEELKCNPGSEMIALFSIPPSAPPGVQGRNWRHFFELGITIFQKISDSSHSAGGHGGKESLSTPTATSVEPRKIGKG
ncbi:unnamed protein product [Ectocarpus sp. 12 AP-2014]